MADRAPQNAAALAAFGSTAAHPRSMDDEFLGAKEKLEATMGAQAVVDASCVAALFAGISRIVDATGLPEDPPKVYAQMEFMLKRAMPCIAVGLVASVVALGLFLRR